MSAGGCNKTLAKPVSLYVNQHMIDENNDSKKIDKYDSPYTMCYKNRDGTYTVYMFASPVSYKASDGSYKYIDNSLVKTTNKGMLGKGYNYQNAANDIVTYFPQTSNKDIVVKNGNNELDFSLNSPGFSKTLAAKVGSDTNMFGDKMQGITYGSAKDDVQLRNYVTKAGVNTEVILNKYPGTNTVEFKVNAPNCTPDDQGNGYICMSDSKKLESVIYAGLMKDSFSKSFNESDGHVSVNNNADISYDMNQDSYVVEFTLDDKFLKSKSTVYPVKFDTSFDSYLNKQPDSGVYSNMPSKNAYLSPISVIGNSDALGIGRQYIRFRFDYFFQCDPDSVLSAKYHLNELTGFHSEDKVALYKMNTQWSSTELNWDEKPDFGAKVAESDANGKGDVSFDITGYVKKCFADPTMMTESYGLLLKGDESQNKYRVFASSDNSEYPPYVEIRLKSLPNGFISRDNINPIN